ncbi:hypothetical protein BE221DRAFT_203656 [Ostreococcus tauri]|uniref:Uncharacterized protein n=1 Tax=Ostreococcus tauri TaxID=70448 RepID=A0A1Y5IG42_OSTTA|nr:hypothetical protein BE221DRAFT_203656 [Ostreococcus tauri]
MLSSAPLAANPLFAAARSRFSTPTRSRTAAFTASKSNSRSFRTTASTTHRFVLLSGRDGVSRTRSPTRAISSSSCALTLRVVFTNRFNRACRRTRSMYTVTVFIIAVEATTPTSARMALRGATRWATMAR